MKTTNIIGWIMAGLFAFCALPQCIESITNKHSDGISIWFISMWLAAEILAMIYMYRRHGIDYPMMFNYMVNIVLILPILYYAL